MNRPLLALMLSALLSCDPARAIEVRNTAGSVMDIDVLKYTKSTGIVRLKRISDGSNVGGFEYDGYLMVMEDPDGKIVGAESNMASVKLKTLKDPALLKKAFALSPNTEVPRDLIAN